MSQSSSESGDRRLRVGSLFSGYGGLDLAVNDVFDTRTVWFSEINEAVARIFAHHWPDASNLGDITTIDWNTVEPVDMLCGGFPCQDVSTVGKRAGLAPGTRSGLWARNPEAATHIGATLRGVEPDPWSMGNQTARPLRALGAVLGDLADLRYDARWIGLPASAIGAPHPRFRTLNGDPE